MQILQKALENNDPKQRSMSLKLLINTQLLDDENGVLMKLSNEAANIPHWPTKQIEPSNIATPTTAK